MEIQRCPAHGRGNFALLPSLDVDSLLNLVGAASVLLVLCFACAAVKQFMHRVTYNGCVPLDTSVVPSDEVAAAMFSLPSTLSAPADSTAPDLVSWVYAGFENIAPAAWPQTNGDRATIAPTNDACDELNASMLTKLDPSTEQISHSIDCQTCELDTFHVYTQEFIRGKCDCPSIIMI